MPAPRNGAVTSAFGRLTAANPTPWLVPDTRVRLAAYDVAVDLPKIISVDDHVVEPPHVWQEWLPEKWRERGPHVERKRWGKFRHKAGARYDMTEDPEGQWGDAWYYDGRLIYVHKNFVAIPQAATTVNARR